MHLRIQYTDDLPFLMVLRFGSEPYTTVFAGHNGSWNGQGDVLYRMTESTSTTVTDCKFLFQFNNGDLVQQLERVAAELAKRVLHKTYIEKNIGVSLTAGKRIFP
jgi:hypothetical protein